MELWIRSQDKLSLIKVNRIEIFHHYSYKDTQEKYLLPSGSFEYRKVQKKDKYIKSEIVSNDEITLGTYKTKERALEVLDEISSKIKNRYIVSTTTAIISKDEMTNEYKRLNHLYSGEFIMEESPFEIKPISNDLIYYEMPKE